MSMFVSKPVDPTGDPSNRRPTTFANSVMLEYARRLVRLMTGSGAYRYSIPQADWGEQDASHYDRIYSESKPYRHHYTQSQYYFLWSVIADRLERDISGQARILDIGCGAGQFAELLYDRGFRDYRGVDFSPVAIRMARERVGAFHFSVGDARDPSCPEGFRYNTVVCLEVLEHIAADLDVIRNIRAGTHCYLSVPSFPYMDHVRFFETTSAVEERYGSFFGNVRITAFRQPNLGTGRYFLLDGIRTTNGNEFQESR